ncbi:hypothetical protein PR003_g9136 [Phytophthora rubi]|uniref:RxLR effector protein n=1 Tax=Phytophthora rubi TaxID=129364 RepID=A0A6A3MUG6_9STRA|nr:hypothetical protein PR002_g8877 [Phytophthora rubi]KAE9037028.1 hypothetical protein PR001_g8555 [Phytophthora rubi]KAE9343130.1 hypothetical protein PR003_g9136 [Phytophthora rubi]
MKAFFLVFASVLFTAAMAMHMPWHKEHPKHPSKHSGGKRALTSDENAKFELGEDDIGDDIGGLGGVGGLGGIGGIGGLGGIGGIGGIGGVGGLGGVGVRALRGNELAEDANKLGDDEVVVAGGRAVRGGVVVTGPRRGPFY